MVGEMAEEVVERGKLSELYIAYAPDGIRLAFLLTGDRALAEDLVQDAFVRLVGRLRHMRERTPSGASDVASVRALAR
jgi:DNA-directed RNA polymerase specialized sigma24 family protein